MTPRANKQQIDGPAFMAALNRTLNKYHSKAVLPTYNTNTVTSVLKRQSEEALTDQVESSEDELYYGSGTIGATAPQTFTFDFDTGSSDLFVPGPSCGTAQGCPHPTKYSQGGTDEHNTTSVTYGSGQVSGENYYDSVTVAGLTATHQNVVSLTQAAGFASSNADGLLGMAFSSIAESKQPTYFETLMAENKVATKEFAFYLGRAKSNTQAQSELTLGGRDTSRFTGPVTQVPVSSETYWQVPIDNAEVNGVSAGPTTKGQAAIDTGTTVILAPNAAAAAIFAKIPGSVPLPLLSGSPIITLYAYPCNYAGNVTLGFAGKQFVINPLDFNFGALTSSFASMIGSNAVTNALDSAVSPLCVAGIAGGDIDPVDNLYVVGDVFIKNWYSIFNYVNAGGKPSVSFAKAVGNQ